MQWNDRVLVKERAARDDITVSDQDWRRIHNRISSLQEDNMLFAWYSSGAPEDFLTAALNTFNDATMNRSDTARHVGMGHLVYAPIDSQETIWGIYFVLKHLKNSQHYEQMKISACIRHRLQIRCPIFGLAGLLAIK
jgi:hypothetical protein